MRLTEIYLHIVSADSFVKKTLQRSLRSLRHVSFGNSLFGLGSCLSTKKKTDIFLVDINTPGIDSVPWVKRIMKLKNPNLGEIRILLFASKSLNQFDIQKIPFFRYIQNTFFMSFQNILFMDNFKFFINNEAKQLLQIRKARLLELRFNNLQKQLNVNASLSTSTDLPSSPWFLNGTSPVIKNIDKKIHYYASLIEPKSVLLSLFEEQIFHDDIVEYLWHLRNIYHSLNKKSKKEILPLIKVDFKEIPPLFHFSYLLGSSDDKSIFKKAADSILFIQHIEYLDLSLQQEICNFLDTGIISSTGEKVQCMVIISASLDLEKLIFSDYLLQQLFAKMESNILFLPNLSERTGDLPNLIESFYSNNTLSSYVDRYKYHPLILDILIKEVTFTNYEEILSFLSNFEKLFGHLISEKPGSSFILEQDLFVLCLKKFLFENKSSSLNIKKKLTSLYKTLTGTEYLSSPEQFMNKYASSLPTLKGLEKSYINYVLNQNKGNVSETARVLGITRKTLYSKVEK